MRLDLETEGQNNLMLIIPVLTTSSTLLAHITLVLARLKNCYIVWSSISQNTCLELVGISFCHTTWYKFDAYVIRAQHISFYLTDDNNDYPLLVKNQAIPSRYYV